MARPQTPIVPGMNVHNDPATEHHCAGVIDLMPRHDFIRHTRDAPFTEAQVAPENIPVGSSQPSLPRDLKASKSSSIYRTPYDKNGVPQSQKTMLWETGGLEFATMKVEEEYRARMADERLYDTYLDAEVARAYREAHRMSRRQMRRSHDLETHAETRLGYFGHYIEMSVFSLSGSSICFTRGVSSKGFPREGDIKPDGAVYVRFEGSPNVVLLTLECKLAAALEGVIRLAARKTKVSRECKLSKVEAGCQGKPEVLQAIQTALNAVKCDAGGALLFSNRGCLYFCRDEARPTSFQVSEMSLCRFLGPTTIPDSLGQLNFVIYSILREIDRRWATGEFQSYQDACPDEWAVVDIGEQDEDDARECKTRILAQEATWKRQVREGGPEMLEAMAGLQRNSIAIPVLD